MFLRNHDELTLEMVTDEDRDYMYKVYATDPKARLNLGIRRRLAPLLGNNRRKIELLNALLFSLPGTPVIYYGDEIGMGDNFYLGDRNGVRTPMQWSADRNAGFSRANPQRLYLPIIIDPEHHYEAINVEAQQQNLSSTAVVDEAADHAAQALSGFQPGHDRVSLSRKPPGLGFYPSLAGRDHPHGGQSVALRSVRRDRSFRIQRKRARGAFRPDRISADRRPALLYHLGAAQLLLVQARGRAPRGAARGG